MSKKREQIQRRRQVTKARRGRQRVAHAQPTPPPVAKEDSKANARDVWLAVGIVALIIIAFVAFYYFAVKRPSQSAATPTESVGTTAETAVTPTTALSWSEPPAMAIDTSKTYEAIIKTEKGDIRVHLEAAKAPITVNNFVFLARQGFYDGVTFHRVIPGFMAQAGDPTGTGTGGPGYTITDEFATGLSHDSEGVVAMANTGASNSGGSQFYITYGPATSLDGRYSIFGRVTEGMDVVEALTARDLDTDPDAPPGDKIITIEIVEE